MKIVFDLNTLVGKKRSGIGNYTWHLMDRIMAEHPEIELVGIFKGRVMVNDTATLKSLLASVVPYHPTTYGDQFKVALWHFRDRLRRFVRALPTAYTMHRIFYNWASQPQLKKLAAQGFIYHETNYIPCTYPARLIISVHDLSHIRYPEYHPKERVKYLNRTLPQALKAADKIITGSEFSRQELLACFDVDPAKVVTVLDGVDPQFKPMTALDVKPTLDKYGVAYQGYILSVCTIEPRKNLVRLLQAFSALPDRLRKRYPLVLSGEKGWSNRKILEMAEPLLQAGELIFTGYLPQADLPFLYAGAKVFAYPSLYEGFGLPVLEAMASGVPIVTSNVSSLPEVSAGSALEVDPLSVDAITHALQQLLEDEVLIQRCIARGLERAKLLTWSKCVRETVGVYASLN